MKDGPEPEWTLKTALPFLRQLQDVLKPVFVLGLGGSVLFDGKSYNDLDVYVLRTNSNHGTKSEFDAMLLFNDFMKIRHTASTVRKSWRAAGSDDNKIVEVWDYKGRRVDFFLPNFEDVDGLAQ